MTTASLMPSLALKAKFFRGFSDSSRLAILDALRDRSLTVGELVVITGLNQPNVSNHLACLHDCGLLTREQRGKYVHYRLSDDRVSDLLSLCDTLLTETVAGIDACMRYANPEGDH